MNSLTKFVKKQVSFIKYFGKNLLKPISLDSINEEHERELRIKNHIFKKHLIKDVENSKKVLQAHVAHLKSLDISKELDYINQRKQHQQKQLIETIGSLLESIELDENGYIQNKKKSTAIPKGDIEAFQKQQEQQQMKLNQNSQQNVSINDLDSIFKESINKKEDGTLYINPNKFDFDKLFKKAEPFDKEKYLKDFEEFNARNNENNNINNNNNSNNSNNSNSNNKNI